MIIYEDKKKCLYDFFLDSMLRMDIILSFGNVLFMRKIGCLKLLLILRIFLCF